MPKRPTTTTISSGYYSRTALNDNFTNIRDQFDNTLSLDGSTPNTMLADLDLGNKDILNAGAIAANSIEISGVDLFAIVNRVTISTDAPSGGTDGDIWFLVSS